MAPLATIRNGTVLDLTLSDWNRVFAVNIGGAFLMSRAILPAMIAAGGGSIIHIASQLGSIAAPRRAAYCATKGALIQLAKAMATDHAAQKIRVNALSPGAVETERLDKRFGDMETARRTAGPEAPAAKARSAGRNRARRRVSRERCVELHDRGGLVGRRRI
jgi:NAD(P)-dependent dehydrogenase (short-subunit alcohol dehydrogenase family)